jgi:hypothetical protein
MLAMTRGIYVRQKTARSLGVPSTSSYPDLLFDARNQPANAMTGEHLARAAAEAAALVSEGLSDAWREPVDGC